MDSHYTRLSCGHAYHERCADCYLSDHNTCPHCRGVVYERPPQYLTSYALTLTPEDAEGFVSRCVTAFVDQMFEAGVSIYI